MGQAKSNVKSLTLCQIKITNIGVRELRTENTSKSGIELLTACVINKFRSEIEGVRGHSWIRYEITHILSRKKTKGGEISIRRNSRC